MSLLEVKGLNSYYGDSHILFDVSLRVERNEVVALLGRNGAGKSTTLRSLMGVVTPRTGSVLLDGIEIAGKKSHAIARAGMQLVHEDRRIFGSLDVEENLILAGLTAPAKWPLDRIYAMFPRLKQRRGSRGLAASLALAQRVYIINNGHIAHEGPAEEIKVRPEILQRYLGV
jgi:branched-chain amino acid transport system ATP-binding protein